MRTVDLIEKKASGEELTDEEIKGLIRDFTDGNVPDYQMSAMMMAIRLQGMNDRETAALTLAMMNSGDLVDLSDLPGIKVDKHSTGGVGDTTTLVIAPLVAACGGTVAKMSGRGLGHTGGTLDKMESIPGTNVGIGMEQFKEIVKTNGVCVIGQSGDLDPADKKMYALRDVTGTVKSIPLIASSIMSKKLAAGSDAILLDVKVGTGAFMETVEDAHKLASLMVQIGKHVGREVRAVITDMNQPLGMAVGNALEVREAIELLSGKIPETDALYQVCMLLGSHMLVMGHVAKSTEEAERMLKGAIASGEGLRRLQEMFHQMGGDSRYVDLNQINELCKVRKIVPVTAQRNGVITGMHAEEIGNAAQILGAGRATKEDIIDPAVGLVMEKRQGAAVQKGDVLCRLYINDDKNEAMVTEMIHNAITIEDKAGELNPMVYAVVTE